MMVLLGGERRNIETSLTCGEPPAKTRENHHKARHGGEGGNGSITTYDSQVKFYTGCNPRNGTIENAIRQPFIDVSCAKANPSVFLSLFLSLSLSINKLLCGTLSCASRFSFSPLLSSQTQPVSQPASDRSIVPSHMARATRAWGFAEKRRLLHHALRERASCFHNQRPGLLYVFGIN